jgi:hypothetical protein
MFREARNASTIRIFVLMQQLSNMKNQTKTDETG